MNNLWCDYIKERLGHDSLSDEDGFITYSFTDNSLFIRDAYIRPEAREKGQLQKFLDQLVELAKERHLKKVCTSIAPNAHLKKSNRAIFLFLLKNKFEMVQATNLNVFFVKEL